MLKNFVYPAFFIIAASTLVACDSGDSESGTSGNNQSNSCATTGCTHHTYVLNSIEIPLNATAAQQFGFDLNGDAIVDNKLSELLAILSSSLNVDIQSATNSAVDTGRIILLADIYAPDLTTASTADFSILWGANSNPAPCTNSSDLICGNHLLGTATFDVVPLTPAAAITGGSIAASNFSGGPGSLTFQLSYGDVMDLPLTKAHAAITGITAAGFSGKIGGAIKLTTLTAELSKAFSAFISADCTELTVPPACGCSSASAGQTLISLLDADQSCSVSVAEIQQSNLLSSILSPDLDTDKDGVSDSISAGFGISGVAATWTAP